MNFFQRICITTNLMFVILILNIYNGKNAIISKTKRCFLVVVAIASIVVISVWDMLIIMKKAYAQDGYSSILVSIPTLISAIGIVAVTLKKNNNFK